MKLVNVFLSPALILISFEELVVENDFSVGQRLLKVYRHSDTSVSESLTLMNASQAFHLFGASGRCKWPITSLHVVLFKDLRLKTAHLLVG